MSKLDIPVRLHNDKRGLLSVEDGQLEVLQLSADGSPPKRLLSCPTRLVLRARLAQPPHSSTGEAAQAAATALRRLDLHALGQKSATSHHLSLKKIHVLVEATHAEDAEEWVDVLMKAAYPVSKPFRHVLLLVNPIGGKGKAQSTVKEKILPILEAAGCTVELKETTHRHHATEITRDMDLKYDVIATASGDGLVYEVLNGLAQRPDARRALRTPIAPLPTGSACACCTNLFGAKDTFNVELATLNAVKGQPFAVDLCSILLLPSKERHVSFLSTALGLMVDLDLGTEHLRWMGDARFMYGFIRGVTQNKPLKARLRLDVVSDDKKEMASQARTAAVEQRGKRVVGSGTDPLALIRGVQSLAVWDKSEEAKDTANGNGANGTGNNHKGEVDDGIEDGPLPPATPLQPDDSWFTIESTSGSVKENAGEVGPGGWQDGQHKILYLYAGLLPWVSRDLNQWPVAQTGSGVIDLCVQRVVPRTTLLKAISNSADGGAYWLEGQHYYKVRAFTAENLDKARQPLFTVDGEAFPFDEFHVEVLPRAARLLALDGRVFVSEFLSSHDTGK